MEMRQLRYFVEVARERNFTRAAARLNIAQPPLSRQIQQLEDELGIALIERGSRPIRLTEAGRLVFDQAVDVLERIDGIRTMAQRLAETERRHLRIGFVASTLYGYLPEVIRRFREARLGVVLTLQELTSLEQMEALREGRIDVGFGRIPFEDPALERRLLRNENLIVAVPRSGPLGRGSTALTLAQLQAEPLIVYPKAPRPSYADQVLALFRDAALRPAALHEVRELQTALGLVAAESGVCIVPACVQHLRRDNVAYRPLDAPAAVSPIIMSTRRHDPSSEVDLILRLLRQLYQLKGITFGA